MQVEVNVLCVHTNFDGCRHSGFGGIATFKNGQNSLSDHGLYKFFDVHGFKKAISKSKKAKSNIKHYIFDDRLVIKKFNRLELAQKNHASRGQCIEHAHQF